ncbi:unnamed protein product [Discosporangium mesarthrocarpum]
MLLFGFTLASVQPPSADGTLGHAAFESRVLFTLLMFSFSLLLEFALDLTNPFVGRYKVRRTTTTALLIKIRNEIVQALGVQYVANFDRAFNKAKRKALRDFMRQTGVALPKDSQGL